MSGKKGLEKRNEMREVAPIFHWLYCESPFNKLGVYTTCVYLCLKIIIIEVAFVHQSQCAQIVLSGGAKVVGSETWGYVNDS